MVSGLIFDYGVGTIVGNDWKYDFASFHLLNPEARFDGTAQEIDPRELPIEIECGAQRMSSLAVPLIEIANSEDLMSRIGWVGLALVGVVGLGLVIFVTYLFLGSIRATPLTSLDRFG